MQKLSSILLVDDDSTTNFLNELLLKRLGIADKLLTAQNGREALATLNAVCPDANADCPSLILLDVNMPVMNGIEFLEVYAQLPITQRESAVVIMLTTSLHSRDLERVQELPVAGLVNKPLTKEKVESILQVYFQRHLE
ncbi:response regulator [Hymenobacter sp. BT186]|uniref:Response regulator n=1 Tax=Hymenobacter telluris TaxID=2816474 RepID=A0A939EV49_9BACT|nr:response regulator [Hymenobacter telluris]MBO0357796.1 response regulator [Hymenobacter telluris]MBW3373823.1 response regulator [Hymenobacter norwichensis]